MCEFRNWFRPEMVVERLCWVPNVPKVQNKSRTERIIDTLTRSPSCIITTPNNNKCGKVNKQKNGGIVSIADKVCTCPTKMPKLSSHKKSSCFCPWICHPVTILWFCVFLVNKSVFLLFLLISSKWSHDWFWLKWKLVRIAFASKSSCVQRPHFNKLDKLLCLVEFVVITSTTMQIMKGIADTFSNFSFQNKFDWHTWTIFLLLSIASHVPRCVHGNSETLCHFIAGQALSTLPRVMALLLLPCRCRNVPVDSFNTPHCAIQSNCNHLLHWDPQPF